jgi:hypothetical protein
MGLKLEAKAHVHSMAYVGNYEEVLFATVLHKLHSGHTRQYDDRKP